MGIATIIQNQFQKAKSELDELGRKAERVMDTVSGSKLDAPIELNVDDGGIKKASSKLDELGEESQDGHRTYDSSRTRGGFYQPERLIFVGALV